MQLPVRILIAGAGLYLTALLGSSAMYTQYRLMLPTLLFGIGLGALCLAWNVQRRLVGLLAAAAGNELVGLLVMAGLLAECGFAPRAFRTGQTNRLAAFTTTVRMVAGAHRGRHGGQSRDRRGHRDPENSATALVPH